MYQPAHRREPAPAARGWRAPLTLVVALTTLLLPVSAGFAVQARPGADRPGAGQPAKPGKPAEKPEPEPVWTGTPGTNAAHDGYGYAWPAAPDCDESDVSSAGCVNDGVGFFQGQCTSWVAHRLAQRNGLGFSNWYEGRHWGNASEWSRVAKRLGYVSDEEPSVGAVGWYARGHVSYVEEVNSDGSVVVSEMNTDGHNGFVVHTVHPGDHGWPDRFLHLGPATDVDATAPARPEPVTARAVEHRVEVAWRPPSDNVGVTGYRVLRNGVEVASTELPAYVDRQASPDQAYTYSIVAHDAVGNVSEPGTTVLGQNTRAPARGQGPFLPGSTAVVDAGDSTAVCGRLGSERDQRIGCRLRTLTGWQTVRAGRPVGWGLESSRIFVAGDAGKVWFCRVLGGETPANACLPLDLATRSWGFDRVDTRRPQPGHATWVPEAPAPTRCGTTADRASCSTLLDRGWRTRTTEPAVRPGDPLSRAFVGTRRGAAFCRTVEGHATCTELVVRPPAWGRTRATRADLPHGRWVSRPAGPTLCLPAAGCRTLGRVKG